MDFYLRPRTKGDTDELLTWCYDGIYSFYDNNIQQEKIDHIISLASSNRAFSVVNEMGELIGNCEFYNVGDNGEEILAVGVQMKPSLTGKGLGTKFCREIVEQGRKHLHYSYLELAVADFNKRAQRTYEKVGFKYKDEFDNEIRGEKYRFIIMCMTF